MNEYAINETARVLARIILIGVELGLIAYMALTYWV